MYADFAYYQNTFSGDVILTEKAFNRCGIKAEAFLNNVTSNRIGEADGNIKNCFCELCDLIELEPKNGGVSSENNDGYSVVYDKDNPLEKRMYNVCKLYLGGSGLLYRGVEKC